MIYSHGFLSYRRETGYLASHGFLVAAADHPLTKRAAPVAPRCGMSQCDARSPSVENRAGKALLHASYFEQPSALTDAVLLDAVHVQDAQQQIGDKKIGQVGVAEESRNDAG